MAKPVLTPAEAARRLREAAASGIPTGVLFGNERAGLTNDEVALADCAITIPTDPAFPRSISARRCFSWATNGSRQGTRLFPWIDHGAAMPALRDELLRLFGASGKRA